MVLGNSNLIDLEILIDEMRYKSYKFFKGDNNYNEVINTIKNKNNFNFLLEEEFVDLVDKQIGIYIYNNRLITTENDTILFMVNINEKITKANYRHWVTLIRLVIGCFNNEYINYNNDEIKLVIKELKTLNKLMDE